MHSIAYATIAQLRKNIEEKKISSQEIMEAVVARFAQYDQELGSMLEVFDSSSVLSVSVQKGPLAGIPGVIKDNICQQGRIASCASKILERYQAPYDATASTRLKQAGALLVGRANMDEFAMGSSTETSAFQKTKNPWNTECVPGGSSGGSIVAVAAGMVPWALGTETGGSVRHPAALCGIVGLKPTYGRISRYGVIAYGSSLDQIGIAARTVRDTAAVLSVISGPDTHDSTTVQDASLDYEKHLTGILPQGFKLGILENALYAPGVDIQVIKAIEEAIKLYEKLGAKIVPVKMPIMDYAAATYFIVSRAEAASNLSRYDGVRYGLRIEGNSLQEMYAKTRGNGFGAEVKARILIGNYVLSAGHASDFYHNARKARQLMREEFKAIFKNVDLILSPVTPGPAFKCGAFDHDKLQMDLQDYFTCAQNLAGIPAISVPCGMTQDNLPLGMQLFGPALSEGLLLQVADVYERHTQWHTMRPPLV